MYLPLVTDGLWAGAAPTGRRDGVRLPGGAFPSVVVVADKTGLFFTGKGKQTLNIGLTSRNLLHVKIPHTPYTCHRQSVILYVHFIYVFVVSPSSSY